MSAASKQCITVIEGDRNLTTSPIMSTRRPVGRPAYFLWAALALVLATFAVRLWDLGGPSLWADEIMTEYRAQAPLYDSLENILLTIDQVPVYFLTLRVFPTDNELLLRLPSALMAALGTALVIAVSRRLFRHYPLALLAGAWLAFNPFHIWLSRMARAYALIFFMSLLVSYLFLRLWQQNGMGQRRAEGDPDSSYTVGWGLWLTFTVVSLLAYMTHYSLLAVPMTQALLLLFHIRHKGLLLRRWIVAQTIAVIPMLGWLVMMLLNYPKREPQWGAPPGFSDLPLSFWTLTAGKSGEWAWYVAPGLAVAVIGLLLFAYRTIQAQRDIPARHTAIPATGPTLDAATGWYWLGLLVLPMLLVFAVSLLSPLNMYLDRYFMALLPALTIIVAYGWASLPRYGVRLALAGVLVTGLASVIVTMSAEEHNREDWRAAAAYVEDHYHAEDVLVVDRAVTLRAFLHYFQAGATASLGAEPVAPLRVLQLSEVDELPGLDGPARRFWVIFRNPVEDGHRVTAMPQFDPFDPGEPHVLTDWLLVRQQYVVQRQDFHGISVLLIDLAAEATSPEISALEG